MADLRLFFELNSKLLAISSAGPVGFGLPPFRQEDVLSLEISIMREINQFVQPRYEVLTLSGWSLRVTVGTISNGVATAHATTTAFTLSADGKSYTGELSLNTAGIAALTDGATIFFEIIATFGTSIYGKRFQTTIEESIFSSGVLVAPPGDTALGLAEATRKFVPLAGCAGFQMQSPGGFQFFIEVNDDGSFRVSPIS